MPTDDVRPTFPGLWVPPAKNLLDPRDHTKVVRVGGAAMVDLDEIAARAAKYETKLESLAPYIDYASTDGPVEWADEYDSDFRRLHDAGAVTLLISRYSQGEGPEGHRMSALDMGRTIERLEEFSGIRASHLAPDTDELIAAIEDDASLVVTSVDEDGGVFKNRFAFLHMRRAQLLLMVAVGSALKIRHDGRQTFVEIVSHALNEFHEIGALGASAPDRITRNGASSIDLLRVVRLTQRRIGSVWVCDGEQVLPTGPGAESIWLPKSAASEREGRGIKRRTTSHLARVTEDAFNGDRMRFPFSNRVPGGMYTFKSNRDGLTYIAFDTPASHPAPGEAKYGDPQVQNAEGSPADAVETLRLFFARVLVPGITLEELGDFLVSRHWSTQRLRSMNKTITGAHCAMTIFDYTPSRRVSRLVKPIIDKLDFYRTGVLGVTVGTGSSKTVKPISGMAPVGGWGEPDAFDRLQALWDEYEARAGTRDRHDAALSGLPIEVDGFTAHLRPNPCRHPSAPKAYAVTLPRAERQERKQQLAARGLNAGTTVPNLEHDWLVAALLRACLRLDVAMLTPLVADDSVAADIKQSQAGVRRAKAKLKELVAAQDAMAAAIEQAAARDVGNIQALIDVLAPRQDQRARNIEEVRVEIHRLEETMASLSKPRFLGVRMDLIDNLAFELEAGRSEEVVESLRHNITDLRLTMVSRDKIGGGLFRLTGNLVFACGPGVGVVGAEGGLRTAPFEATLSRSWGPDIPTRVAEAISLMRAGVIDDQARGMVRTAVRQAVTTALGPVAKYVAVFGIKDADLLRLTMAILAPDPVSGEDPARFVCLDDLRADEALVLRFGGTEALERLISRIRTRIDQQTEIGTRGKWSKSNKVGFEPLALLAVAARDADSYPQIKPIDWTFETTQDGALEAWSRVLKSIPGRDSHGWYRDPQGRLTLPPCPHCSGTLLARMLIREPVGLLCLAPGCRRDASGVRFDEAFDPYIEARNLYVEAGVPLRHERPIREPLESRRRRPNRQVQYDDLSASDRALIAKKFVDISRTARDLDREHGLRRGVAKRCANEAGLTRLTGRAVRETRRGAGE